MKCFCTSLCILSLFSATILAEEKAKPCQGPKPEGSQSSQIKPSPDSFDTFPCECALIQLSPGNWIGEKHPINSQCSTPIIIDITGGGVEPGVCQTETCTGDNCLFSNDDTNTSSNDKPVLNRPLTTHGRPFPEPSYCTYTDPVFIELKTDNRKVYAKVYTVVIDIKKMATENPNRDIKPNTIRGEKQILLVGFETTAPPKDLDYKFIKPFESKDSNQKRALVNFGLRTGIVFFASKTN